MSTLPGLGSTSYDIGSDMAVLAAESAGVCIRPHVRVVTDLLTGDSSSVPIPCGSTREAVCGPCAIKARRLRMHQCREGWHRTTDPLDDLEEDEQRDDDADGEPGAQGDVDEQLGDEGEQLDDEPGDEPGEDEPAEGGGRRVRSTRRLDGFADLPTVPMEQRTTGRAFTDPATGATYRPSMFLTLTLPSYGKVIPGAGVPVDPARYDYRRAALDALLWPRLLDRFWQNLRRCAGYKVQYFSAIEAQRRLAPHVHAAVRGAIPRQVIKAVTRASYYAAWWPPMDEVVYDGDLIPTWDRDRETYVDPTTNRALPSWEEATADLHEPAHVVQFGTQVDIKGLLGGTDDSDRAVRYLCKYLTKNVADTYATQNPHHRDPYERHTNRLHTETRWLPCSPSCANWLRYGVTPKHPGPGLVPGQCAGPAHERENLGLGGRRVLVSRQWSGKTLTEHRADRRAVVAQVLAAAGIEPSDVDRLAAEHTLPDGAPRYVWEEVEPGTVDYVAVIAASLRQANTWRSQYEHAKTIAAQRESPPVNTHSAISARS